MFKFSSNVLRDPAGYEWVNEGDYGPEDGEDRYAENLVLKPRSFEFVRQIVCCDGELPPEYTYDPIVDEPALFRVFARTAPTEEGILDFANRYGDINTWRQIDKNELCSLRDWQEAIATYEEAIEVVDDYLRLEAAGKAKGKPTNQMAAALLPFVADAPIFLKPVPTDLGIILETAVGQLLDVLNVQLITSVAQLKRFRGCEFCGKPFELTPQVNRADRLFCSDTCRVKAHQKRKRQAIEMRKAGKPLREIVKATKSDLATVKRWLAAESKEKE